MTVEEHFIEAIEEEYDQEPETLAPPGWSTMRHERLQHRNKADIENFLGKGRRANTVFIAPGYYRALLAWALQRHIEREGWRIIRTLGYHAGSPGYIDVSTDYGKSENLLMDGQLLLERDDSHFIITVEPGFRRGSSIQVEGPATKKNEIEGFANHVRNIARQENFYRGKKIEFAGCIRFLNVKCRSWDSIILDPATKREFKANTIDFLKRTERWAQYRIPQKRGVLLAGEPGTGKTVICEALMAEAEGVTCIITNAYALSADEYVTDLYEMAQDLSPSIVFIEDIDLIGLNREEYNYHNGPALLSLLNVLDGVEERQQVVTVATTNNLETLDRAIRQRPSRFDRVMKLSLPSREELRELVSLLCQKIPLGEPAQEYIARKAEHCTPAQLQEIVYSLAIEYPDKSSPALPPCLELSTDDIDRAISRINGGNSQHIGFNISGDRDGHKIAYVEDLE